LKNNYDLNICQQTEYKFIWTCSLKKNKGKKNKGKKGKRKIKERKERKIKERKEK
jgi:hypothetical protein